MFACHSAVLAREDLPCACRQAYYDLLRTHLGFSPPPQAPGLRPALLPCDRPPLVTRLILFMGFASASDPMTFRSSRHLSPFGGYTHWSVHLVGLMLSIPPMYWLVGPRALTCEEVRPSDELWSSMSSFGTLDQGASPFNLDQYRQPCPFLHLSGQPGYGTCLCIPTLGT